MKRKYLRGIAIETLFKPGKKRTKVIRGRGRGGMIVMESFTCLGRQKRDQEINNTQGSKLDGTW